MIMMMKASDHTWYVEQGDGVGLKKAEYGEEGGWSLGKRGWALIDGEGYGGADDKMSLGCIEA